jgi:hypothetical protein
MNYRFPALDAGRLSLFTEAVERQQYVIGRLP